MAAAYITIDHKMNDELKAIFDRFHEDVALYNELITREEELLKSQASLQNTDQRLKNQPEHAHSIDDAFRREIQKEIQKSS